MDCIMVDNWFMEEVIADIRGRKTHNSYYYAELLMAIVLWDEVYYPRNSYNWWTTIPSQVQNAIQPIEDFNEDGKYEALKELYRYKGISTEELYWLKWKESSLVDPDDIVSSGAIRYLALSAKHGFNYLPCTRRQDFLREYCKFENMQINLHRINLQNSLTKAIEEYYVEAYKALIDFTKLEIKMPVLADFIINNATDTMTPVDFAFHLKNEGSVIKYRHYLGEIENALEQQNWKELRFLLRCSDDAVNSVLSMDKKFLNKISVEFCPIPSVIYRGTNITASIPHQPFLEVNNFEKLYRKFNLTFLKDVTKYAINDMHRW